MYAIRSYYVDQLKLEVLRDFTQHLLGADVTTLENLLNPAPGRYDDLQGRIELQLKRVK